jgi:hypothetical protein
MANGDGAAIHVHFRRVNPNRALIGQSHYGEGLIL